MKTALIHIIITAALFILLAPSGAPGEPVESGSAAGIPEDLAGNIKNEKDTGGSAISGGDELDTSPVSESGDSSQDLNNGTPQEEAEGSETRQTEQIRHEEKEQEEKADIAEGPGNAEKSVEENENDNAERSHPGILIGEEKIGLFAGYGGFFPVAAYSAQYGQANLFSATVSLFYVNIYGISPELHFRYAGLESTSSPLKYGSTIKLVQAFPGLIYRYEFSLPRSMSITPYGRLWDGFCRLEYESRDPYFPLLKRTISENINVFGLGGGFYLDLWEGILFAVDLSYSAVATAGTPLQSVTLIMSVGYRL